MTFYARFKTAEVSRLEAEESVQRAAEEAQRAADQAAQEQAAAAAAEHQELNAGSDGHAERTLQEEGQQASEERVSWGAQFCLGSGGRGWAKGWGQSGHGELHPSRDRFARVRCPAFRQAPATSAVEFSCCLWPRPLAL